MALIWNWLAALVYQYGVYGAGQPSYHSSYEADVPEVLRVTGNGSGAGHSNYMYAYVQAEDYYGAKWQVPDMLYYKCTSSRLVKNTIVTPGGRANTKYEEQQGLDRIMIEGQFRPH